MQLLNIAINHSIKMGNKCCNCGHSHNGLCGSVDPDNPSHALCPCGHIHVLPCFCGVEHKVTKKVIEKIPIGSEPYEEYETRIIGHKKVMKRVEEKEPYTVSKDMPMQRTIRVPVTRYKTEYYTEYEQRTESYYCPYQGMSGNVSYRTTQYPTQKQRQVSYQDYEDKQETYYSTGTETEYRTKFVDREVDEPITEQVKVKKQKIIYKEVSKTVKVDEQCHCRLQTGCRCWQTSLTNTIVTSRGHEKYFDMCHHKVFPCEHINFMTIFKWRFIHFMKNLFTKSCEKTPLLK